MIKPSPDRQSLSGHQARDGYRRAGRGGNPGAGCARRRASIQRSNVFARDADFAQSSDRMLPQRCKLSRDPHFSYHTGLRFHLSAYGMYGFAILSSMNYRQTMQFAEKYHQLATPLTELRFKE